MKGLWQGLEDKDREIQGLASARKAEEIGREQKAEAGRYRGLAGSKRNRRQWQGTKTEAGR